MIFECYLTEKSLFNQQLGVINGLSVFDRKIKLRNGNNFEKRIDRIVWKLKNEYSVIFTVTFRSYVGIMDLTGVFPNGKLSLNH